MNYHDLLSLIWAQPEGDLAAMDKIYQEVSLEGWRDFVGGLRTSNTGTLSTYVARKGGREMRAGSYSCGALLLNAAGIRRFWARNTCGVLAEFFEDKLSPRGVFNGKEKVARPRLVLGFRPEWLCV